MSREPVSNLRALLVLAVIIGIGGVFGAGLALLLIWLL